MKKLNTACFLLCCALLFSPYAYSQNNSPITQWRKASVLPGTKASTQKLNPPLKTQGNISTAASINDGADIQVHPSSNVQSEVTIAIDRNNPKHLLASANTYTTYYNQGYYYSTDGGATWNGADELQNISGTRIGGDPSVSVAADGTEFMTSIGLTAFGTTAGYWFQRSTNAGATWSTGIKGNSGANFDKGMNTADNLPTSPFANNFYMAWTDFNSGNGAVAFNRSTDKGATFSNEIILRSGAVGFGQGTNVQTGPNGEVYVCWADHTTVTPPFAADGMGFARSGDGGASFSPARVIFPYTGTRVDYTSTTYNHTRVNDFPSMAVDKSNTARRGRIYITYPELVNGHSKIKVRFSDNRGRTWSNGVVVNIPNAREAFFPWVTVDDKYGIVWVAYYAFDKATGYSTNTYIAGSVNGTKWYNQKVSDVPHITAPINDVIFATGYAGDYIGIAAYGGRAFPTWMDDRNGTWQAYTSPVTVTRSMLDETEEEYVSAEKNLLSVNPNPVKSFLHVNLSNAVIKSVHVYYQSGALARQWNSGDLSTLNVATLPKGIYTVSVIDANGKSYSQKILKE